MVSDCGFDPSFSKYSSIVSFTFSSRARSKWTIAVRRRVKSSGRTVNSNWVQYSNSTSISASSIGTSLLQCSMRYSVLTPYRACQIRITSAGIPLSSPAVINCSICGSCFQRDLRRSCYRHRFRKLNCYCNYVSCFHVCACHEVAPRILDSESNLAGYCGSDRMDISMT